MLLRVLWQTLLSRRWVISLLLIITSILIFHVTFQNLGENLPSSKIYRLFYSIYLFTLAKSYLFLIFPALLFVSVLACTINRLSQGINISINKGQIGFWGSIGFHLGMLIMIIGVMISLITRFSGGLLIVEGQSLPLEEASFIKIHHKPRYALTFPQTTITLDRFVPEYQDNQYPVDYTSTIILRNENLAANTAVVKVNQPLIYRGYEFLLESYGFTPLFIIRDNNRRVLFDAYINLKVLDYREDSFEIPDLNLTAWVRFFPDFYLEGKTPRTRSRLPRKPVFGVILRDSSGRDIFRGLLARGEKKHFKGYTMEFRDLKYWVHFQVIKDRGLPVLIGGICLSSGGLIVRFLFPDKKTKIAV